MPARLNPYLNFNGTTREAMTFYQQVLGGKLDVSTFDEFGGGGEGVMHAQLETPDGLSMTTTCASVSPISFWMVSRSPLRVAVVANPG